MEAVEVQHLLRTNWSVYVLSTSAGDNEDEMIAALGWYFARKLIILCPFAPHSTKSLTHD